MSNSNVVFTILHNGETVTTAPVSANITDAQIKDQCVANWAELSNATIHVDRETNRVTFTMPTGTKQAA